MITCMSIAGTDYIYVNYVNSTVTDDVPDNMVLLKMDWEGSVVGKYTLDRYCRMYTVSEDLRDKHRKRGICFEQGRVAILVRDGKKLEYGIEEFTDISFCSLLWCIVFLQSGYLRSGR